MRISPSTPSEDYGELQKLVDELFQESLDGHVKRVDLVVRAEINDFSDELMEVVNLLPSGTYSRSRMCDQLNSIITAHGWGYLLGTLA
ncbi:MAG: hypothetical protein ACOX4F_03150 [Atopobiaceae bacterium]|jgi:hypothetical protein